MEEQNGRQENGTLLTREEEASLHLLEPLFARHLDLILDTLARHLRSDPTLASLLSDDVEVVRLKRSLRDYLLSLLNKESERSVGGDGVEAADYGDPFGLGLSWQRRILVDVLTSIQPLAFDAVSWTKLDSYHTIWNALLKVVFHDLESAMSASLKQRDDMVEAARRDTSEARRALDRALNKQAAEEEQRQAEHRTVVRLLTTWLTKTSELAQEMGTPLNVILGRAESLLERTEDEKTYASLQSIVKQVERLIPLRQELCTLNHEFNSQPAAPDRETMTATPLAGC